MYRVLHVDLDQFIAAVEILRRPELAGRPVVVGGKDADPTRRGVVATANYVAREYGVRSGMPLRTAVKRCPDAVFLPADKPAYEAASERVMAVLRGFAGVTVEVMGWDEAFVGAAVADDAAAEELARRIQAAVAAETRLTCAVGIGDNLLRAKIATEFGKPGGRFTLTAENWVEVMGHRPTRALWGIGAKTAAKLAERALLREHRIEVVVCRDSGGDLTDWADVRAAAVTLAHRVAEDVRAEGRPAARVGVKVRFAPFTTKTRSMTLPEPTSDTATLEAAALEVLERFHPGRPVRLVGVRAELAATPPPPRR